MLQRAVIDPVELSKIRRIERENALLEERANETKFHPQINESSKALKRTVMDLDEDAKRRIEM